MISTDNQPLNDVPSDSDFTLESYEKLVNLAVSSYQMANYRDIPWGQRFLLWRHDCDYSLNRSLALAKIEADLGLKSTFFLNPHCDFYNLLESTQRDLIFNILKLGHDIGLHFDSAFFGTSSEEELNFQVSLEADLLENYLGLRPGAFSFHNPKPYHLTCEEDTYGGLVNCYSKRFKQEVPYCSDSNGYWRFLSLVDVLENAEDPCIQVLTHPGWWQVEVLPPRERIFRSTFGRASAVMDGYDLALARDGRENVSHHLQSIHFLRPMSPKAFRLLDYMWNCGDYPALFVELWRLHQKQINELCRLIFLKEWKVSPENVNDFFGKTNETVSGYDLFSRVCDTPLEEIPDYEHKSYKRLERLVTQLLSVGFTDAGYKLEDDCLFICKLLESLSNWGISQSIGDSGLGELDCFEVSLCKTKDDYLIGQRDDNDVGIPPNKRWEKLNAEIMAVSSE
jgi:hypothetical protein